MGNRVQERLAYRRLAEGRDVVDEEAVLVVLDVIVATHNHVALDHGGRVFNRTAPVIKPGGDCASPRD